jgi:hypothetical protein
MAKTMLAISLLVGAGACSSPAPTAQRSTTTTGPTTTTEPTTTVAPTTTVPPTTTSTAPEPVEEAPTTVPTTRARSAPTTVAYVPVVPRTTVQDSGEGADFWYRLATCESENGRTSANQFQFMGGTAEKVGYYAGASYAEQKAMAQGWAARLRAEGTHPGSTAGWPECWWIAGGA